ncbi:hypothetical protein BGZ61DRAFT_507532 [Ilyonectria robusta]|uniref:uncharacterized protein n=1 Tax=Ilyonectria robusta TaxID=1079257 RepID=UPI001E8EB966|nr:uncharacterized protein BGZ61DRAFT_507532 [Ilyonectria robusta]KAH8683945.1 hypothetical protein BGZ61DRAFT_507532 [Ilyonectria robusta]
MSYGTVKPSASKPDHSNLSAPLLQSAAGASPPSPPVSDDETPTAACGQESHDNAFWEALKAFYVKNIGLFFVFVAQVFASIMSMTTRLLETGFETKFHALQIIFVRMLTTAVIGSMYMWYQQVPDFPWGHRGVRGLLVIRGMAGSTGLFGLYYSLSYLDISDATVITFLIPTLTTFVCWVILNEPFTFKEASASFIAFVGVLVIARPAFLFPSQDDGSLSIHSIDVASSHFNASPQGGLLPPVKATPAERSIAIVCAILGSFAAATAYAIIRTIGKRAHSLVSVNYFAVLATVSSFLIIMIHPDLQFEIPQTPIQWALLLSIGLSGFLLQVFLTEGLKREKAGRATNLIYSQMIFALIIERVVWGTTPPLTSLLGSILIIGAAVWVSLQKKAPVEQRKAIAEERGLLDGENEERQS